MQTDHEEGRQMILESLHFVHGFINNVAIITGWDHWSIYIFKKIYAISRNTPLHPFASCQEVST